MLRSQPGVDPLLARTFGDIAVVERLFEENEGGLGPLGRALLDVAPAWALLEDVASTAAIMQAVRAITRQRDSGQPMRFALQQIDMLGGGLGDDARSFLAAFLTFDKRGNSRLKGRERLVSMLGRYIEEAEKQAAGDAVDLLGDTKASPAAMIEAIAGEPEAALRGLLDELQLDPEAATVADIRTATEAANEGATLFQGEPVVTLTGDELGDWGGDIKKLRTAAIDYFAHRLKGLTVHNPALGPIQITGGRKAFSSSANPDKLKLFPALPDVLASARLMSSEAPARPSANVRAYHFLEAPVSLEGAVVRVGITVREDNNGRLYYNHNPLEDEGLAPSSDRTDPAHKAGGRSPEGGETFEQSHNTPSDGLNLTINQGTPKGSQPRGSITFGDGKTLVRLFEKADLSTVLHESGHLFLEVMTRLADRPEASAQLEADLATIRKWVGNKGGKWKRDQHEQFARGVEAYLFEGKAPSIELQSAFDRFRSWLVRIYRHITRLNVELNDDVRGVFDRMLATEEQIEAAERASQFAPILPDAEASGMTAEEHAAYLAQAEKATRAAKGELLARAMAEEKAARSAEYRERREALRAEASASIDQLPAYRAIAGLSKGFDDGAGGVQVIRLDRTAVDDEHGREVLAKLTGKAVPPIVASAGIHPDDAAPLFGYATGDDMDWCGCLAQIQLSRQIGEKSGANP